MKRVFLIVLDSFGIGELPDAAEYGDQGSNTLRAVAGSQYFDVPNMTRLGLFGMDGTKELLLAEPSGGNAVTADKTIPLGAVARMGESSKGKDTTTGHWEIAGLISKKAFPTFPNGFPEELLKKLSERTGRRIICNKPYSGTAVIEDYGTEQAETGALIVYTSADSVLQIAAHEESVPVEELYRCCEAARELCTGKYAVGRVIARPFAGSAGNYARTVRRHDYSLEPDRDTMLDLLKAAGKDVIAVGKINDIFAGRGTTEAVRTSGNAEGIQQTIACTGREFNGLCFTNLVDFDMLYGHRNDVEGYAKALTEFDRSLPEILAGLRQEDLLMITADHGCDPSTPSTDHSREYTPLLICGQQVKQGVNLGTRNTFADISATVLDYLEVKDTGEGSSFLREILL